MNFLSMAIILVASQYNSVYISGVSSFISYFISTNAVCMCNLCYLFSELYILY